jgi:hypothetical protein
MEQPRLGAGAGAGAGSAAAAVTALTHIRVAIATYWTKNPALRKDRWLEACVRAVAKWPDEPLVRTVVATVYVNDVGLARASAAVARVAPLPDGVTLAVAVSALHGYTMSRAHLSEWAALAQDPASRFSAFVYLEDDIELTTAALRAWDTDEGRLVASGASGAGFHRGFFRYELSSADDGGQRADGRYVVDERRTRWWNNGSCAAAATECGADAAYCASHPFVRVRRHGLFVALHNSYFAATVATKAHVAAFARTRGWNRTRHKAYGVREFSASGIQYYDDFAADRLAPVSGWWPPRERQDARRILVPVHFFDGPSGAGWRLAADAGLHHLSDRHVRQTIEQAQRFGSFRENETLRCAPRARRRPPRGGH